MSPEAQRLAIAEAAGWACSNRGWWSHPILPDNGGAEPEPPDYLNDLNAMHEAEKAVLFKDVSFYLKNAGNLENICGGNLDALYATAAQRAEAFLRTIGKWEDA